MCKLSPTLSETLCCPSAPIVVGGQSEIKIVIRENRVLPMVSADGQHSVSLNVFMIHLFEKIQNLGSNQVWYGRPYRNHNLVDAINLHSVSLNVGDSLHIRKHPFKLSLLHPPGYDFYMASRITILISL
jgi:NAD+ kinase